MPENTFEKSIAAKIEAVLFYKNEPVAVADLARILAVETAEIENAAAELAQALSADNNRGITLVSNKGEYSLATAPHMSETIEKLVKDELNRDLSAASLETLSIIAYKGTVTRKEIEYIRGVNASFSLRNLLIRGLIEREASESFYINPRQICCSTSAFHR